MRGAALVPGGFTGPWMWADVAARLEEDGIESIAVELPTIGEDSAGAGFYADARAVREVLDRLDPPCCSAGTPTAARSSPRRPLVPIPPSASCST